MTRHQLDPSPATTVNVFSRDLPPVLTVDPGDTIVLRSLNASGHLQPQTFPGEKVSAVASKRRSGHCLTGPIAVRGAVPGEVLAMRFISRRRAARAGLSASRAGPRWRRSRAPRPRNRPLAGRAAPRGPPTRPLPGAPAAGHPRGTAPRTARPPAACLFALVVLAPTSPTIPAGPQTGPSPAASAPAAGAGLLWLGTGIAWPESPSGTCGLPGTA